MLERASAIVLCAGLAASAGAQIIVSEVFYNPSGVEPETEWLEIANVGTEPVDVSTYMFADEDNNSPSDPIGAGAYFDPMTQSIVPGAQELLDCDFANENCNIVNQIILQPGEAMVVLSHWEYPAEFQNLPGSGDFRDGEVSTIEDFIASWGEDTDGDGAGDTVGYKILLLPNQITIANTASATNEVLHIIDGFGEVVHWSNYEVGNTENQWPYSSNGRSIYLQPNFFTSGGPTGFGAVGAVDQTTVLPGEAWALSVKGVDRTVVGRLRESIDEDNGATFTLYGDGDIASPGTIPDLGESFTDFNNNGRDDAEDIILGFSDDCNRNRIPDEAEPDGNNNGVPDDCEIQSDPELDCDGNGIIDQFDIANDPALDANGNGVLDLCENTPGYGSIVITEIMFNPSGTEREWIEIYNGGSEAVDLEGWFFQDLDQPVFDGPEPPFPAFTLEPGGVAVIGGETLASWEAGWGPVVGYQYLQVGGLSLANNADVANEVRTLIAPVSVGDGTVNIRIDVANYQGTTSNGVPQGGWPGDDGRGSFYHFNPQGNGINRTANNNGRNWALAIRGLDGAVQANQTNRFDGRDVGSPGFVNTGAPQRAEGSVIISEIMFATNSDNPADAGGPDGAPGFDEWVEILNVSGQTVDLSGWYLADEDGETTRLPQGATLAPNEAAVIIGGDRAAAAFVGYAPVEEFYAAWDCGYQVFAVERWYTGLLGAGLNRLGDTGEAGSASNPSTGREILTLRDANDAPIDVVNYDDDGFVWPLVPTNGNRSVLHPAIFIFSTGDLNEQANDDGLNWGTVPPGPFGARANDQTTTLFNGRMSGSPGFVQNVTGALNFNNCPSPEPCYVDFDGNNLLDLNDITQFVDGFSNNRATSDLAAPFGLLDLTDLTTFIQLFVAGCN